MGVADQGVECIEAAERASLVAWLDDGLRRGHRGTLQREYPLSLHPLHPERHRVVRCEGRLAAHAMVQCVSLRVGEVSLEIGLIGLVYTDPSFRGQGLASRCVEACVETLRREGSVLALLWSDQPGFYRRLGFGPVGRDDLLVADAACLARARTAAAAGSGPEGLQVEPCRAGDLPYLEGMYARKAIHVERPPGALAALVAGPEVEVAVAHRGGAPVAYAARGRGDDFRDIVHEWAGDRAGVLACCERLRGERPALGLLTSPAFEGAAMDLLRAGAVRHPRAFGLARLLDAGALLRAVIDTDPALAGLGAHQQDDRVTFEGDGGSQTIPADECRTILLGSQLAETPPDPDDRLGSLTCLSDSERSALAKRLPWPLYVWGFDSI